MHDLTGANDAPPKSLTNTLMSETNTQDRRFTHKALNHRQRDPCLIWCAGPRRENNLIWSHRFDLIERNRIIPIHLNLCPELTQKLHHVVGEGIIVVDHQ